MAVACVKHEYLKCLSDKKMDGLKQEWYPCKNWSSLMIFNCAHPDTSIRVMNECCAPLFAGNSTFPLPSDVFLT